jgi:hypothetical protein
MDVFVIMTSQRDEPDIRLWHEHKVLKAIHLRGRDVTVRIKSIAPGKITGVGGKSDKMPMVEFEGKDLPLGLNKTNTNTLVALYGSKPSQLVGKLITLYPTTTKGKEGTIVECIRIRPVVPRGKADALDEPAQADPDGDGR